MIYNMYMKNNNENDITTIRMRKSTQHMLERIQHKNESFNDTILRLLELRKLYVKKLL